MPSFPRSSPASAPCRLEWRPSRWLLSALAMLTLLAPLAVLGSDLPRHLAWPLAIGAGLAGAWRTWREAGRAPRELVLAAGSGSDVLDGQPLEALHVAWRGPLAFVQAVDALGRRQHLVWWPDTLPGPRRRELRLALALRAASRPRRAMAP